MGFRPDDCVMLVMPMCHINSIYYSFAYTYVSARVFVYNMISFDPEDLLRTIEKEKITFTSLVPTHYIMMLALPDEVKKKIDVSSIRQLLISSAPARKDTKLAIMDYFKNAELWEAYGSTEAGLGDTPQAGGAVQETGLHRQGDLGVQTGSKSWTRTERKFRGEKWESFIHERRRFSKSTGKIRKRQSRFSRESGSRRGTWPIRTRMAILSWSIERRT